MGLELIWGAQHAFFKCSEPLRTLTPLIKAARDMAKAK